MICSRWLAVVKQDVVHTSLLGGSEQGLQCWRDGIELHGQVQGELIGGVILHTDMFMGGHTLDPLPFWYQVCVIVIADDGTHGDIQHLHHRMTCQWVRCCREGVGHCIVPCCLGCALQLIDNRLAIETVQQVQRAVLGY